MGCLPVEPHAAARGEDSASQDLGRSVRVGMMSENREVQTTFLVGLKDAWYTDYGSSGSVEMERRRFYLVYSYRNLARARDASRCGPGLLEQRQS